jgi:hypothetical protein
MLTITHRKSIVKGQTDVFAVCDIAGFAELAASVPERDEQRARAGRRTQAWDNNVDYDTSLSQMRLGDLACVPASDKILESIESENFLTQSWRVRHDVCGGVPNVGAFLAGHPLNMRRRERVLAERGPISIFVSTELSAHIDADIMQKRGIAILAFVRLLSNTRPVELYTCCSVGDSGFGGHVICKIDTAPLDLARAAHVLTAPGVTRNIGYASCAKILKDQINKKWCGHWAYGSHDLYLKNARAVLTGAVNPNAESLLIPAAHKDDPAVNKPVEWLRTMLHKHGGLESEAA